MTDKLVNEIEKIALSGEDLIAIAKCLGHPRAKFMLYDDLVKFKNVNELFGSDFDSIYILLQIRNQENNTTTVGHWVCFIYHRDREEYYWFDPYGLKIAQEMSITHEPGFILDLIKDIRVDENTVRHQKFSSDINTCGRHCVVRSVFNHLDNTEYNKLVIRPIVPIPIREADSLVALMTGLASDSDKPLIEFFNKKGEKRISNQKNSNN